MDFPYGTIAVDGNGCRYMVLAPVEGSRGAIYHLLVLSEVPGDGVGSLTSAGVDWLRSMVVEDVPWVVVAP